MHIFSLSSVFFFTLDSPNKDVLLVGSVERVWVHRYLVAATLPWLCEQLVSNAGDTTVIMIPHWDKDEVRLAVDLMYHGTVSVENTHKAHKVKNNFDELGCKQIQVMDVKDLSEDEQELVSRSLTSVIDLNQTTEEVENSLLSMLEVSQWLECTLCVNKPSGYIETHLMCHPELQNIMEMDTPHQEVYSCSSGHPPCKGA